MIYKLIIHFIKRDMNSGPPVHKFDACGGVFSKESVTLTCSQGYCLINTETTSFLWLSNHGVIRVKNLTQEYNTNSLVPVGFELSILWLPVRASNHCATVHPNQDVLLLTYTPEVQKNCLGGHVHPNEHVFGSPPKGTNGCVSQLWWHRSIRK